MSDPTPPADDCPESRELVRRAQDGEREALERLYERYYDRVRRIVRMRLGPALRGSLESGDILQETFAASVQSLDGFEMRDDSSLIHWLSKIAENQIRAAADYHGARKRDRRRDVSLRLEGEGSRAGPGVREPSAGGPGPLEGLTLEEETEAVEEALSELREEYREVVLHRDYAGASWRTIAEWIGAPSPDAARMLYARAVTELSTLVRRRLGP